MAYILPSDVRQVMRKLPVGSFPDSDILYYIEKASAYLDGLLGGVFVVPFDKATLPPIIKHIVIDLTVFFIEEALYSSQKPNLDEYKKDRYERIMKMIGDIIDGTINIGIPPINSQTAGFDSTNLDNPIFTLDDPYW